MSTKIIVADDSQTIQKIVKMTLENEDFDLYFSSSEKELLDILAKEEFSVVLLDFSLSDGRNGFQLAKVLRSIQKDLKVLMMFGTFDSVEVEQINQFGINSYLVKPFDSAELIQKTRELLLENQYRSEIAQKEPKRTNEKNEEEETKEIKLDTDESDQWVVSSTIKASPSIKNESSMNIENIEDENTLEKQMKTWGMEIPPKIKKEKRNEWTIEEKLPSNDDLQYPQIKFGDGEIDINQNEMKLDNLIEEDDFKEEAEPEKLDDTATINFTRDLEFGNRKDDEKKTSLLQEQIEDEIDVDNFWKADFVIPKEEQSPKSSLDSISFRGEEEIIEKRIPEAPSFSKEEILTELSKKVEDMVRNTIDETVRRYSKEIVEKIAWETIPDLAENYIKKELAKIAEESKKLE